MELVPPQCGTPKAPRHRLPFAIAPLPQFDGLPMRHLHSTLALSAALAVTLPVQAQFASMATTAGVDGYMTVPYDATLIPQSGITVEAWVTYDDTTLPSGWNYPTICRQGQSAGDESYFLRVSAENSGRTVMRWRVVTATGNVTVDWPFTSGQLNVWTHIAATWDGSTARMFVNGAEVGSSPGSGPIVDFYDASRPQDFNFSVGRGSPTGGIEVWNGEIDEFRFWPFARTGGEIAQTKDLALLACPAGVSTWALDNDFLDSSAGRDGTGVGTYAFNAPAPMTVSVLGAVSAGTDTPGCNGDIVHGVTAQLTAGNPDFALIATGIPSTAVSVAQMSFAGVLPAGIPILGFDLWIDVSATVSIPATPAGLDTMRATISASPGTPSGLRLATQFLSLDPCGPMGITASDAIALTTL